MNNYKEVITCHAGARDAYELSIAFQKENLLKCLVTDAYLPNFLGRRYGKRFSEELPFNKVTCLYGNVILQKIFKQSFTKTDSRLSNSAYKKAIGNNSSLFLCSYTAYEAFSRVKAESMSNACILFQLHPHPLGIRQLLEEELLLVPSARESILKEPEMNLDINVVERLNQESVLADHCVVASTFTRKTLIDNGIKPNKITVIPYGVDSSRFPNKLKYSKKNGSIKIAFVGQMIQRKGLYYLLEAVKMLRTKNVELTLIGRGVVDLELINNYKSDINLNIKINLSHNELVNELHSHDMLFFPSLIEGFGHVILEAMSAGLPVLCTQNTAGPDLFITGREGVIVPIRDAEAIAEQIEYFIRNKSELEEMGLAAAATARVYTWQKFRDEIAKFYYNLAS
jgi:hypothetical protein